MSILQNMSVPIGGVNSPLLMPKLSNRFRVSFVFNNSELITSNVMTVTRPTLSFDDVTLDVYNSKIKIPGKHTWNDVTVVIRDDINSTAVVALDQQLNRQIDIATQSSAKAAASFKFLTKIETLDGTNGQEPGVLDTWELHGSFIQNIEYGNNDYSSSDVVQISVTIRYDSADHIIANVGSTLSSQYVQANTGVSGASTGSTGTPA